MVELILSALLILSLALLYFSRLVIKDSTEKIQALTSRNTLLKEEVDELNALTRHLRLKASNQEKAIEEKNKANTTLRERNDELLSKILRVTEGQPLYEVRLVISRDLDISFLDTPNIPLNLYDPSAPIKPPAAKEKRLRLSLYTGIVILQEDNLLFDKEELQEKCSELMATYLAETYPNNFRRD